MYTISEKQLEFILNDIRRNGVEMEDLQLNLLDHICCIIEQELEENGDFEQFYFREIKKFYQKELKEIEEETISLLIHKNYYAMKKIMIGSGIISVSLLTMGIILKFLYQPGASFGIVVGIVLMSCVFLPLLFTLKVKENKENKDKVLIGLGTLSAISLSLGILFKVMHWPWANNLALGSIIILLVLFLPVYFVSGIKNQESKTNTIISSILIIAGCGLFLTLVRSPQGSRHLYIQTTNNYLRNEQLLANEKKLIQHDIKNDSIQQPLLKTKNTIDGLCNELKTFIITAETGHAKIDADFERQSAWLEDSQIRDIIENSTASEKFESLKECIDDYNKESATLKLKPIQSFNFSAYDIRSAEALNGLVQIQLYLLQNERLLLAEK